MSCPKLISLTMYPGCGQRGLQNASHISQLASSSLCSNAMDASTLLLGARCQCLLCPAEQVMLARDSRRQ